MAQPKKMKEPELSPEEKAAIEKAEEVRKRANGLGRQILTLTRNGLFVSLRFLDVALCQFDYLSADQISGGPVNVKTIATTGQHLIFDPQYIIEQYMKDKQGLSRDYLHIVLHCIFRHPFVSENLNQEYWDLACDIAVENIIVDLDVKQTKTRNVEEIEKEVKRIRGMVRQVTAEYLYNYFMAEAASPRDIEKWKKLFYRDDHRVWWEIAKQIAEELKKREAEESGKQPDDDYREPDVDEENLEEDQEGEETDESEEDQEIDDDTPVEGDEEGAEGDDEEFIDDTELTEQDEQEESEDETMDDSDEWDQGQEEPEPEEDELQEEEFEDEFSSAPGDNMDGDGEDQADPDSERQETGEDASGEGNGGGNPGDDPEESEEEGNDRSGEHDTGGLEGKNNEKREQSENKPGNELKGQTDEGKQDDRPEDPFGDEEQNPNSKASEMSGDGSQQKNRGEKQGQHSAGTGGGGTGTQSAWEHESGGANRRGEGERDPGDRKELEGDIDPSDAQEMVEDDGRRKEAQAEAGTNEDHDDEDKDASYMHNGDEQRELEEKWKEISERMLVDLETSSKEWGDKSDAMLQGIKKINKDKYDYRTFLQKFSTMKEDIQLNDDEFDYVYYTLGMERYGNIPLIEPLEYKEVRKVRDFVIAIDTSGSCAGEVVQKFLDKTYSIFMQQENFFRKINLHIIQCDAQIQSDVKITSKEEFDDYMKTLEFKGFGGTDFRPVFEYVNHLIEQKEFDDLKGLIYFTDGNGTYPKRRPPYETAFIFVDDDEFEYEVPSWAMKLVLETSDITEEVQI